MSLSGLEPAAWSDAVTCVVSATGISTQKGRLVSAILFPTKLTFSYDIELGIVVGILAVPSVCVSNLECNVLSEYLRGLKFSICDSESGFSSEMSMIIRIHL